MATALDPAEPILKLAFGDGLPDRTLVVFSTPGLNNRLSVLISGIALAEAMGREFAMLWPQGPACGAAFTALFQNPWHVVDLPLIPPELKLFAIRRWSDERLMQLLADTRRHIILGYWNWLVPMSDNRAHTALQRRCLQLLPELQPIAPLAERIESFRARRFAATMIGVHLRRGDHRANRPYYSRNTDRAFRAVDHFLEQAPDAGIFLATDDGAVYPHTGQPTITEGVQAKFVERYGDRVVWSPPRSLDRQTPEAIQDAVVDLWLLRSVDYFVGTGNSSFSRMVVVGRAIPYRLCTPPVVENEWLASLIEESWLGHLVQIVASRRMGRNVPFITAWYWFAHLPLSAKRRLQRALTQYLAGKR